MQHGHQVGEDSSGPHHPGTPTAQGEEEFGHRVPRRSAAAESMWATTRSRNRLTLLPPRASISSWCVGDRPVHPGRLHLDPGHAHAHLAITQAVVELGEDFVAGGTDNRLVEGPVGLQEALRVTGLAMRAHLLDALRQALDQLLAARPDLGGRVRLDQLPGLEDVVDLLRQHRQHQRAPLRVQLDQAGCLQPQQRLADRSAGDADRGGQLALRQQLPAGVDPVQDRCLHIRVHPLGGRDLLHSRRCLDDHPSDLGGFFPQLELHNLTLERIWYLCCIYPTPTRNPQVIHRVIHMMWVTERELPNHR